MPWNSSVDAAIARRSELSSDVELLRGSPRSARIAIVTAGLSVAGGVAGAVCALSAVSAIALLRDSLHALTEIGSVLGVTAAAGALAGFVLAPILAWAMLRRVPLGRAVLLTGLGAVGGAVAGQWLMPLTPYSRAVPGVISGAIVGFVAAGIVLWQQSRGTPTRGARSTA